MTLTIDYEQFFLAEHATNVVDKFVIGSVKEMFWVVDWSINLSGGDFIRFIGMSEGITSVLSALGFLNPGLHLMQTLFILNLKQSSQLLRILLITTTLASLALGHSILATYFKVQGCSSYFRRVNSDHCKSDNITVFQWSWND